MLRWLLNRAHSSLRLPQQKANRIVIKKNAHELALYSGETFIKKYSVAIGPGGSGFKHREGDKVTPVGHYHVIMHQPSQFHQFLRLDYPNADDRARFTTLKASGELPKEATIGGDIGIHGAPPQPPSGRPFTTERLNGRSAASPSTTRRSTRSDPSWPTARPSRSRTELD